MGVALLIVPWGSEYGVESDAQGLPPMFCCLSGLYYTTLN